MLQAEQILGSSYLLTKILGENAGRQTWLAQDVSTQEQVVIKLLTFNDQVQWDNLRLFEREAQVLKQLKHPRIPKYRNYFQVDDEILWFGLVQEYIPGASLKELLTQGKIFSQAEVRKIARDVLNILIYLHELNPPVLHRDIKPSNLLMGKNSQIYLVDFGAVQDRAAAEGATFTVVGTFGYAPLEQFGGRATPASDLYALGATLIHLLTGIAPADLPQKDSRLQFDSLVKLNPGFVRWLRQMTEPNLENRFRSASLALEALNANEAAISALVNSQPNDSRIKLKKSGDRLQVKIPIPGLLALGTPENLVIVVLGLFLLWFVMSGIGLGSVYAWMWLIAGILVSSWFILPIFIETNLSFDHQQFEIEWKLLGFCLRRQRGKVSEIDKVFTSKTGGYGTKKLPEVTLAVGVEEYTFGTIKPPLTLEECRWLAAEIRHWLGL
ncbi:MAG: serine/threonine protein kinase [Heteroscytonema crispum UTEX LB 1556]